MAGRNLNKLGFMTSLGLRPTNANPEKNSSTILERIKSPPPTRKTNTLEANENTTTGYENFCIKKGNLKLLPFKDFDFIGNKVVCQKCFQTFASRRSYRAHVDTTVCDRTYNGKNLVYLKYKSKHSKRKGRRNINKVFEDQIKNEVSNPETLNVLQTRNKRYSHEAQQRTRVEVKRKRANSTDKSDEPSPKKPKRTPQTKSNVEPKRGRGRPKKIIPATVTVDSATRNIPETNVVVENNGEC